MSHGGAILTVDIDADNSNSSADSAYLSVLCVKWQLKRRHRRGTQKPQRNTLLKTGLPLSFDARNLAPRRSNPNEFLRSFSTRGPAHDFEYPNFVVGSGCAETTTHQSAAWLDLRSGDDQGKACDRSRGLNS